MQLSASWVDTELNLDEFNFFYNWRGFTKGVLQTENNIRNDFLHYISFSISLYKVVLIHFFVLILKWIYTNEMYVYLSVSEYMFFMNEYYSNDYPSSSVANLF